MASAPAGSRIERVSWNTSLIAAHSCVGVDQDDLVEVLLAQPEGLFADLLDRGAVGEQPDIGAARSAGRPSANGPSHRSRWSARRSSGSRGAPASRKRRCPLQPAAADADEDRVDRRLMLAQDLHADRALAGDHVGVVERVHEGEFLLRCSSRVLAESLYESPCSTTSAPRPRTASTLSCGVVTGITITARQPSAAPPARRPAHGCRPTPQITPRASCSATGAPSCCRRRAA
jgi:hypothetical protein